MRSQFTNRFSIGRAGMALILLLELLTLAFSAQVSAFATTSANSLAASPLAAGSSLPVLLVYNDSYNSNKFGRFLGEIMKAEGFNLFDTAQLTDVTATSLSNYDSVVLAETSLTSTQATMFTQYVQAGGNLIAMRPDGQLASLFGLSGKNGTINNGYMAIQTATPYGQGFVPDSLQLHPPADKYSGATGQVVALLYSNASTATTNPAVVVNNFGSGTATAFTYDLAANVVYTRQGNPAQADTDADGDGINRIVDMYYNWIDLNKMPLPQADIQQRLFARILGKVSGAKKPLPRFWYFPNAKNSTVILTSDAHANPDSYYANMVSSMNRLGVTTTFYLSQAGQPSAANVNSWKGQGYVFSTHPYEVDTTLSVGYDNVDNWFDSTYGTRTSNTVRVHRLQWQGWVDGAKIGVARNYFMDYTYYRYGTWLQKPDNSWARGYMTGSDLPMKLIDQSGQIVNDFAQYTEIADDQMLNNATGPENLDDATALVYTKQAIDVSEAGNNQSIAMQMHVDNYAGEQTWAESTISYAKNLGIPIYSGENWYKYTNNRYNSTMSAINWSGSQLSFTATIPSGQSGQTLQLPYLSGNGGAFTGLTINGSTTSTTTRAVRGENFVFVVLPAGTSSVVATYNGGSNPPPTVSGATPATVPNNAATTITINGNNFLATPTVQLGTQFLSGVTFNSGSSLSAVVPAGLALGSYSLKVINPDGQNATLANAVTVALPAPTLSGVSPNFGSNISNVTIGLTGTNFVSGATVKLGSTSLASVTFNSATSLSAVVPAGTTPGTYSLTVTNPDSQSVSLANAYTVSNSVDITPPVISGVASSNVTSSGATIAWTTDEPATTQVDYGTTTSYGSSTTLVNTLVTAHSQALTGLNASQLYHYRVRSTDAAGNTAVSGDFSFTTGTAAPVTLVGDQNIEGNEDNNPAGTAEAFQYTATASGVADKLYIYLDNNNSASKVVVGLYTDNANNPGSLLGQVTITAPVAGAWNSLSLPTGASLTSGQKYWIAVLGPTGSGTVQFRDTGSGGKAQASAQSNLTTLPGSWSAGATYGNSPMSAYAVQTGGGAPDTQAPTVSLTAPANGATVTGTSVTVSATASDNVGVASVQFLLDGNPLGALDTATPYTITWDTTTATNASHILSARALDAAGNPGIATNITVTVNNPPADTQAPLVSLTAPAAGATVSGTSVTVSATATDNVGVTSVQFLLDGNPLGSPDTATPYTTTWDTTTAANGTHILGVQATDAAGNTGTATTRSVTVSNLDSTPPVISAVSAGTITSSGATISWTTNEASTTQVDYGLTTSYGSSTTLNSALVTSHSQAISGLAASTTYHYRVKSTDSSGNTATSGDFSFVTASASPTLVLGSNTIQSNQDDNSAGTAEAFQYTATATGTGTTLNFYVDTPNTATKIVVGIYTNNTSTNNPSTLLAQATLTSPTKGAWNTVTLTGVSITSGQKYWIAILGPVGAGTVKFRDSGSGGRAQTSSQTTLTTLPTTWTAGSTYNNSPMSAYLTT